MNRALQHGLYLVYNIFARISIASLLFCKFFVILLLFTDGLGRYTALLRLHTRSCIAVQNLTVKQKADLDKKSFSCGSTKVKGAGGE